MARFEARAARRERALPWRKRKTNALSARRVTKNNCVSALATTHRPRSTAAQRLRREADLHKATRAKNLARRRAFSRNISHASSPDKTNAPIASARRSVKPGLRTNKTVAQRRAKSGNPTRVTRVAQAHVTRLSNRAFKTSNNIRRSGPLSCSKTGNRGRPRTRFSNLAIEMRATTNRQINSKFGATGRRSNGAGLNSHPTTRLPHPPQRGAATRATATVTVTATTISTTRPWPNPAACACPNA